MDLVARLHARTTRPAELEEALRLGQRHLHALGITAWQDAIVEPHAEERAYVALASRGELTGRVVGALWWDHHRGAEQIEEFVERRRATAIGRYAPTSVKLMMDGVLENFTGAMLEPYLDGHGGTTDNRGLLQIDPDGLATWVPAPRRARVPAALPRDRRPGGPGVARRRRGGAAGERAVRHAAAHRPHPGHPSRRHRRGSASSTSPPTPSRCGRRTRTRWTC